MKQLSFYHRDAFYSLWLPWCPDKSACLGLQVKGTESKTPLLPQQRRATQAAPTLRLKLKLGASEAQLSVPGSEDEDASRVRLPATCHC